MAQPAMNAKIEELRFRLKTDPKSRIFFPLAEELRKAGQLDEAEQVLRTGLAVHATYLSAWVSLGRVLRDQKKDGEAVDALNKALQLDPGNVVAARLLADAYLNRGEKIEAIKKYKLVHALLPSDELLEATIATLESELHPPAPAPEPEPEPEPEPPTPELVPEPVREEEEDSPFDRTMPPFSEEAATGDAEPMSFAHEESPFEEPVADYSAASMAVEAPQGMHIEEPEPEPEPEAEAQVFEPVTDVTNTLTMADLYARQGLVDDARQIYEHILVRDPSNDDVRAKLEALNAPAPAPEPDGNEGLKTKVARLEDWLAKVGRKEVGGV